MAAYGTIAEAQAYFDEKLYTAPWDEATSAQRTKALAEATRRIDRLNFRGSKTDSAQENAWPRTDTDFDDDEIPVDIMNATFEVALALLDGVDPDREHENLAVTSDGYSSARSTYSRASAPEYYAAGIPCMTAWTYLRPLLSDVRAIKLRRV